MLARLVEWFVRWRMDAKSLRLDVQRDRCRHSWLDEDGSSYKRVCMYCGRREWLMGNPYPDVGEPAYEWTRMN
jgi:hypothetical protein